VKLPPPLPCCLLVCAFATLPALRAATGAELFVDNCASCHGADGKARTPIGRKLGAKDLGESNLSEAAIIQQITNGKKNERGGEKMPAFKDKLTPADIAALATYVKGLRK
jgi:mono/diheme cytochrome c family protein